MNCYWRLRLFSFVLLLLLLQGSPQRGLEHALPNHVPRDPPLPFRFILTSNLDPSYPFQSCLGYICYISCLRLLLTEGLVKLHADAATAMLHAGMFSKVASVTASRHIVTKNKRATLQKNIANSARRRFRHKIDPLHCESLRRYPR